MHLFIILYVSISSLALVHLNYAFLKHLLGLCLCQLGLLVLDGGMRLAQFGATVADRAR